MVATPYAVTFMHAECALAVQQVPASLINFDPVSVWAMLAVHLAPPANGWQLCQSVLLRSVTATDAADGSNWGRPGMHALQCPVHVRPNWSSTGTNADHLCCARISRRQFENCSRRRPGRRWWTAHCQCLESATATERCCTCWAVRWGCSATPATPSYRLTTSAQICSGTVSMCESSGSDYAAALQLCTHGRVVLSESLRAGRRSLSLRPFTKVHRQVVSRR